MEEVTFENVQELLNSGKKPEEVFDWVDKFQDGFACVYLNGKWNFIDKNWKLLSTNQWFNNVSVFNDGFAWVKLKEKWNIIDKKGKQLLTNQLFDMAYAFPDGFAVVGLNGKWNYINKNGKILSPNQWFDNCDKYFYNGFAFVKLNGKRNLIDKNGNLYDDNKKPLKTNYIYKNGKLTTEKENKEKKILYIVLLNNEYVDSFTNAEEALDCIVEKQSTGQISVVKKLV